MVTWAAQAGDVIHEGVSVILSTVLYLPGSQAQYGGDVVFCRVVEVNRHVAVQLLSSAPLALLGQPQLLRDHGHTHDEQVIAWSTNRRAATAAAAAAVVATATDWCFPFAALLLCVVAAGREPSRLEQTTVERKIKKGMMEDKQLVQWLNVMSQSL